MKTRKIYSKKEKKIRKVDLIVLILCFVITNIRLMLSGEHNLISLAISTFNLYKNINLLTALLCSIYIIISNIIFKCFLILLVYIPFRMSRLKVIKQNKRYEVIDNIEYYRDEFVNLSPAEISLISDLEIETDKDISATLLKLYTKKLIYFENNKILINSLEKPSNLKNSESYLLNLLSDGELDSIDKTNWKKIAIKEAIDDGYIEAKEIQSPKHFWGSTILFFVAIFLIIHSGIFILSDKCESYMNQLDILIEHEEKRNEKLFGENYEDMDDNQINTYFKEHPEDFKNTMSDVLGSTQSILPILISVFEFIGGFLLIIFIPIYKIIRKSAYNRFEASNKYARTKIGKILAEQIAAMQRYIHEFSLLSEKEKEAVKIWEDFLVYAVILEENENIVNNIFTYKNIKKSLFF